MLTAPATAKITALPKTLFHNGVFSLDLCALSTAFFIADILDGMRNLVRKAAMGLRYSEEFKRETLRVPRRRRLRRKRILTVLGMVF